MSVLDEAGKTTSTRTGTKTARTLEKGLAILSLFDRHNPTWTLAGISDATGIPMPTALRLTKTLERSRYLRQNEGTRAYELGPAIHRAASVPRSHSDLVRVARPYLQNLTEVTTETTAIGVWEHGEATILDMVLTPRPFKPPMRRGETMPGIASVYAKLALAFGPDSVLEATLKAEHPKHTPHTVTDPVRLREEIERIRQDRLAFSVDTIVVGISTVGAPIFDSTGEVIASIAVVAATERFGATEMREYGASISRTAANVSRELAGTIE